MKKILLIIFLFLYCVNVNAEEKKFAGSEYLDGISYMKYDGNTHYYRNAQVIRNTKTNQIAYCVEPFTLLVNDTSYSSSSTYNSNFKINKDSWEKIKLYAYYGYGYQGHTDKKWISITQLSIWRELYPNYQFEWIDNTTSRKIIKPYENEKHHPFYCSLVPGMVVCRSCRTARADFRRDGPAARWFGVSLGQGRPGAHGYY